MKRASAFIWRKSVYTNKFRCNECGCKVANDSSGYPLDTTLYTKAPDGHELLVCPQCMNVVSFIEDVDVEDDTQNGMYGVWNKKNRRKAGVKSNDED